MKKKEAQAELLKPKKTVTERERTFAMIAIPILILFFLFNTLPLIKGFIYSFTNFKGYGSYEWVGLRNYIDLFTDARVGKSYLFTVKLAFFTTILVNVLSLLMALGLNAKIKFKSALRGMYFLPNILGALVVGYIFNYFFTYIVPEDVYEAGMLDGATGWSKFRHLTFPLIIPFFTINMVLCMKNFLMVFDQIMALTKGGPAQSTESISFLIYNNGMSGGQFGFQSANAVIFFIVIVTISVFQMRFLNSKEEQL